MIIEKKKTRICYSFFQEFGKPPLSMARELNYFGLFALISCNDFRPNLLGSSGFKAYRGSPLHRLCEIDRAIPQICCSNLQTQLVQLASPLKGLMQCQNLWLRGHPLFLPHQSDKSRISFLTIRFSFSFFFFSLSPL